MFTAEYKGINDFLVNASRLLLKYGIKRVTRNQVCYELPEPFMFKITDPTARWVTIPERKWNLFLPYAESLWLASGRNDMSYITRYLSHMKEYSDDGISMRGGYGPRLRFYNGNNSDYAVSYTNKPKEEYVDQFKYIVDCFKLDVNTRRAVINLDDTNKDDFDLDGSLKKTKDIPCTRLLHFQKNATDNSLNLTVFMRSNDFLWGASGVNIFNYTFMQEYFSAILGLKIGSYYHIANNFHYYEDKKEMVKALASITEYTEIPYTYDKSFSSLEEFDGQLNLLEREESFMRDKEYTYKPNIFKDSFFKDWYSMLCKRNITTMHISLCNKSLNVLINNYEAKSK